MLAHSRRSYQLARVAANENSRKGHQGNLHPSFRPAVPSDFLFDLLRLLAVVAATFFTSSHHFDSKGIAE
jgi:hypothetical protein